MMTVPASSVSNSDVNVSSTDSSTNNATVNPSSMSTTTEESPDLMERGKLAFNRGQIPAAVEIFALLAERQTNSDECAGDSLHPSMGPVWLWYGRALLESAIRSASILGNQAIPEGAKLEGDEDEAAAAPNKAIVFHDNVADDEEQEEEDEEQEEEDAEGEAAADEEGDEQPEQENAGEEDEEDFVAAWEVLETARLIYSRMPREDREAQLALADVHMLLGDLSLEKSQFKEAVEDFQASLLLLEQNLPPMDRRMAEIHFKISTALDYDGQLEVALEHVEKTRDLLKLFVLELEKQQPVAQNVVAATDKGKGKAPLISVPQDKIQEELEDVKLLIPDIQGKIDDLKAQIEQKAAKMSALNAANSAATVVNVAKPVAVNDLTMLVKKKSSANNLTAVDDKKRKLEEEQEPADQKKVCLTTEKAEEKDTTASTTA